MINYLEKYNNLPKDLRDKISAPHVMKAIHEVEEKYGVTLAALIMRVMVRDLELSKLKDYFVFEHGLEGKRAEELVKELRERVFSEIANYLDYISAQDMGLEAPAADGEMDAYAERFGLSQKTEEEKPAGEKTIGANFYFSIEDEDEVQKQAKDMSALDKREQIAAQTEAQIDRVIGEINVIFSSEDMLRRLRQIVKTYLRGVRDRIDTRHALERDAMSGGLSLDPEIADDIMQIVDKLRAEEAAHVGRPVPKRRLTLPEDMLKPANGAPVATGRDAAYDFAKLAAKPMPAPSGEDAMIHFDSPSTESLEIPPVASETQAEDQGIVVEQAQPSEEEKEAARQKAEEEAKKKLIEEKEKALVLDLKKAETLATAPKPPLVGPMPQPIVLEGAKTEKNVVSQDANNPGEGEKREAPPTEFNPGKMAKARNMVPHSDDFLRLNKQLSSSSGKVRMDDIKKGQKIGGPLEEIGSMNLADFRRISKSPKEAVTRISQLFSMLEEEGFNRKMAGQRAWRQNPVNKLYLAIGQESLIEKKDIQKIIEGRKAQGKEYLSKDEFDAIMELNKKIRY